MPELTTSPTTGEPPTAAVPPPPSLLDRFESGTLEPGTFTHRDHVRLAWELLGRYSTAEVLARLGPGLRDFATAAGAPEKYHETMTWAFVFLVAERRARSGDEASWERFAELHPELFENWRGLLNRYYRPETLDSDLARRTFVLPDRYAPPR